MADKTPEDTASEIHVAKETGLEKAVSATGTGLWYAARAAMLPVTAPIEATVAAYKGYNYANDKLEQRADRKEVERVVKHDQDQRNDQKIKLVADMKQKGASDADVAATLKAQHLTPEDDQKRAEVVKKNADDLVKAEREKDNREDKYSSIGRLGLPALTMLGGAIACSSMGGVGGWVVLALATAASGYMLVSGTGADVGGSIAGMVSKGDIERVKKQGEERLKQLEIEDPNAVDKTKTKELVDVAVTTQDKQYTAHFKVNQEDHQIDRAASNITDANGKVVANINDAVIKEASELQKAAMAQQAAPTDPATVAAFQKEFGEFSQAVQTTVSTPAATPGQQTGQGAQR